MSKLSLSTLTGGYGDIAVLNANFAAIVAAMDNTVSRDGTSPNTLLANLDANSQRILNLPAPVNATEPLRKQDVGLLPTLASTVFAGLLIFGNGAGLTQDSNLAWDNTNKRLGIGTNVPSSTLQVNGVVRVTGVNGASGNSDIQVGLSDGGQHSIRITGDAAANKAPVLSFFRAGAKEFFIAGGASGAFLFGVTSGLADYNDATLTAASQLSIGTAGVVTVPVSVVTPLVQLGAVPTPQLLFVPSSGATKNAQIQQQGNVLNFNDQGIANRMVLDLATGAVTVGSVVTPLLGTDTATIVSLKYNGSIALQYNNVAINPAVDNAMSLGNVGNRFASGTFGTSVVTPLVSSTGTLDLNSATGTSVQLQVNGVNTWFANTTQLSPNVDNGPTLGISSQRIAAVFTPIIDSGTTGSLSLKTNGGETGFVVNHGGTTLTNHIEVVGNTTGNPAALSFTGSDANVTGLLRTKGTGVFTFITDAFGAGPTQLQILHTASATRNIIITGSAAGNPTIAATGGGVAIGNCFVVNSNQITVTNGGAPVSSSGQIALNNGGAINWRNGANSGDLIGLQYITQNSVADIFAVGLAGGNGVILKARSGAGALALADLSASQFTVWKDTSGGTVKLFYNDAGTLKSVTLV